jgi:general nucleoside transport system ATP-binding protein
MLVGDFTIAENLALARSERLRFTSRRALEGQAKDVIAACGIALPGVARSVRDLSVGEKSKLELIKAIAKRPTVLILDEPTSVLTQSEAAELFGVMRRLAAGGTAVVFISHKLPEVLEIAQRIVVMRRGRIVEDTTSMTAQELALAMTILGAQASRPPSPGDESGDRKDAEQNLRPADPATLTSSSSGCGRDARAPRTDWPALRVDCLSAERLDHVSFSVARGEIVAIVGVAGNGQGELAEILHGLKRPRAGAVAVHGTIAHVPEDRTRDGLVAEMTIAENLSLSAEHWHRREAADRAARLIDLYNVRAHGPRQRAGSLSGGNQQKVILARALDRHPEVIVAAEPTRGLDLDATTFVHGRLRAAAAGGAAILLITSDLDEAFALADGIHVIYRGRLSERMTHQEASSRVANLMAGVA